MLVVVKSFRLTFIQLYKTYGIYYDSHYMLEVTSINANVGVQYVGCYKGFM